MRTSLKTLLPLILAAALLFPLATSSQELVGATPALASVGLSPASPAFPWQSPGLCESLVVGGVCTIPGGQVLEGDLLVFGGLAMLEPASRVKGDVIVMGGTLLAGGAIEGDIIALGGLVDLDEEAVVEGNVNIVAAELSRADGSQVLGEVNYGLEGPFRIALPGIVRLPLPGMARVPGLQVQVDPFVSGLWWLFRSFLWAALAVLVVLLLPRPTERITHTVASQALVSGGLGVMTAVVLPLVLLLISLTLIGIPVALVGAMAVIITWLFGVTMIGAETGRRLAKLLKQDWALPVSAAVGTFLLTLVVDGVNALLPCLGWLAPFLVGAVGLGAVLLTRFGTRDYPQYLPAQATPYVEGGGL